MNILTDSDIVKCSGECYLGFMDIIAHRGLSGIYPENTMLAFSKAVGKEIPYVIKPRRPGDIATCYADPSKAKKELGWEAKRGIDEMCADGWKWQSMNPNGYRGTK